MPLTSAARGELFARFLPVAQFIDLELGALRSLGRLREAARAQKTTVILSHHNFRGTPTQARLESIVNRATRNGADIVKIATHTATIADVSRLLVLLSRRPRKPLSVMSMGPWGKLGRLILGCAGSSLNYGYLGSAQVPGQWEATILKLRLAELCAGSPSIFTR